MMQVRYILWICGWLFWASSVCGQVGTDSIPPAPVRMIDFTPTESFSIPSSQFLPFLKDIADTTKVFAPTERFQGSERNVINFDLFFYVLAALFLLFAVLRQSFAKYFSDLFRLFFQTTLKQRQLRDQIIQAELPGFLLLVFFFIVGGYYLAQMLLHYQWISLDKFWWYFLYCSVGLGGIYLFKFLSSKAIGWMLDVEKTADSYIFLVFVFNRIMGVMLLPFIVLLTYLKGTAFQVSFGLSAAGLIILFTYRFLLAFKLVRNNIKINLFHFFLYVVSFEVLPLLIIYKALSLIFE